MNSMNSHSSPFATSTRAASSRPLTFRNHLRHSILAAGIVPAGLLIAGTASAWADAIFAPGNQILGGQKDAGNTVFTIGVVGTTANTNNWPGNESPDHAIDGVAQKYLNFGVINTGFLVNPTFNGGNGSVVSSMQLWTANDSEPRDPATYEIWGTNTALDFGLTSFNFASSNFTLITSGSLALPAGRGGTGTTPLNNTNSQTVSFTNTTGYKEYLVIFPTVKAAANSMQIGEVQLFGIATYVELKWNGNINNVWNVNTTQNWLAGATPSTFNNTNGVVLDDSATGSTDITIQNGVDGVQPAAVVFANNTKNYTISNGSIISLGTLTLNGTGSVTLNNMNSYAAGTTVNAGTLIIGAIGSLGPGSLTVNNPNLGAGTAVAVNFNAAQTIGTLSGAISVPSSGTNTATITLSGGITVNQATDAVYAGVIAGTGGLTKNGTGALTLTGANTYAGPTIVNSGILRSSASGVTPNSALPALQPVTVNAGATLILGADDGLGSFTGRVLSLTVNEGTVVGAASTHSTLPSVTLNGATVTAVDPGNIVDGNVVNYILDGDVTTVASASSSVINANSVLLRKATTPGGPGAPVIFNVPRGTAPVDLLVSSVVKGDAAAGLTKSGNGILALSNSNTYTGPTVINAGTIAVGDSAALGTGPVTINNGGVLSLGSDTINGFDPLAFTFNGGATANSNQTLMLTDNVGSQARSAFTTDLVSFANGFTTSFVYTAGGNREADGITFTVQKSDPAGPTALGGGGGQLGYVGIPNSAAVEFNIYTGNGNPVGTNYAVGSSGVYSPSTPVNLASGNAIQITLTYSPVDQTISETLFDLVTRDSFSTIFSGVDLPSAIGDTSAYIGFTGATGGLFASQTIDNFKFNSFSQGVSVANNISTAAGSTTGLEVLPVALGGAGSATLTGTLTLGNGATLNVTGGVTPSNLPYTLTVTNTTAIAGNTTINVANNGTGKGTLTLGAVNDTATGATLTKTGAGTLAILAAATYTGATTVNGGTLVVNGSVAGATTINNSATLAGTGTLAGVTVQSGGTVAPGNSVGTLTTGPIAFQNGSALTLEFDALTADQLRVNGGATLTGVINLTISLLADPVESTIFTILDGTAPLIGYSGGARLSYLGNSLDDNEEFTVVDGALSQIFTISYAANGGNDIVLVAIPEPSSAAIVLAGLGAALGLRRRRVKH
jgi:fibronectin-binding autotransporter adhesin